MKRISKAAIVEGELRDTPATETELARLAQLRRKGASPGNPKWYKSRRIAPFSFEAGLPAQVPAWTRAKAIPAQEFKFPRGIEDPVEYVKEFDTANCLVPAPIQWIRPTLGAFG